jgi:hypothetical protein
MRVNSWKRVRKHYFFLLILINELMLYTFTLHRSAWQKWTANNGIIQVKYILYYKLVDIVKVSHMLAKEKINIY